MTYCLTLGQVKLLAEVVSMADHESDSLYDKHLVLASHTILEECLGEDAHKVYGKTE